MRNIVIGLRYTKTQTFVRIKFVAQFFIGIFIIIKKSTIQKIFKKILLQNKISEKNMIITHNLTGCVALCIR